jgi:hypothetical protein
VTRNVRAKAWSLALRKDDDLADESACPSVLLMLVTNAPADFDVDVFIYGGSTLALV